MQTSNGSIRGPLWRALCTPLARIATLWAMTRQTQGQVVYVGQLSRFAIGSRSVGPGMIAMQNCMVSLVRVLAAGTLLAASLAIGDPSSVTVNTNTELEASHRATRAEVTEMTSEVMRRIRPFTLTETISGELWAHATQRGKFTLPGTEIYYAAKERTAGGQIVTVLATTGRHNGNLYEIDFQVKAGHATFNDFWKGGGHVILMLSEPTKPTQPNPIGFHTVTLVDGEANSEFTENAGQWNVKKYKKTR